MLEVASPGAQSLEPYVGLLDDSLLGELESLGCSLKGARVAHINATATGGGVAEILHSILPLYQGLGVDASWLVMQGEDAFFDVTKQLHNCLQGAKFGLTPKGLGCARRVEPPQRISDHLRVRCHYRP